MIKPLKYFIITLSVIMAAAPFAMSFFGNHLTWGAAQVHLNDNSNYFAVPAGSGSDSTSSQKSYLLIPKGMSLPTMLTVFNSGKIIKSQFGFWFYILFFSLGWFNIILFLKGLIKNKNLTSQGSNTPSAQD